MKKSFIMLAVTMLCACCLGLAACGGSSASSSASSSAASQSASSAAASQSASSAAASSAAASSAAALSAQSQSASAAASQAASSGAEGSADVSPEFKDFVDRYSVACDEVVAVAEKAKGVDSFDAIKGEWEAAQAKIDALSDEQKVWIEKYQNGEMSAADKNYYDNVLVPKALEAVGAASAILDLIKL